MKRNVHKFSYFNVIRTWQLYYPFTVSWGPLQLSFHVNIKKETRRNFCIDWREQSQLRVFIKSGNSKIFRYTGKHTPVSICDEM